MTLSQPAFERAVRRLDGEASRGFVADLLSARGYRTTLDGPVVTAAKGRGESSEPGDAERVAGPEGAVEPIRFLVVDGLRAVAAAGLSVRADAVVVTAGSVTATAVGSVVRGRSGAGTERPLVRGTGDLYEWFAYAVDGEARTGLAERYLDATGPSALERGRSALAGVFGRAAARLRRLPVPSTRSTGVVLLALLALLAATTAAPAGLLASTGQTVTGGDTPTPQLTPVTAADTPAPSTTAPGSVLPESCPRPPLGAHPASLRPGVIRTASEDGLEGWRLLVTQNITEYEFDPNDQQLGPVPEVRHLAVFETQAGARLRLGLDRWESPARAETVIARGGPWSLAFPWGAYGVWVEWQAASEGGDPAAEQLLAAVTTPDGVGLGGECVSALVAASANATATNAPA